MGMRAVVAYEDKNGNVKVTTNQWATVIHKTIGQYIEGKVSRGVDFDKAASVLFRHITKNNHISNIDLYTDEEVAKQNEFYERKMIKLAGKTENGANLHIVGPYTEEAPETHKNVESLDMLVRNHSHAQDGISAYYSEKEPGVIKFYIDEYCGKTPQPIKATDF